MTRFDLTEAIKILSPNHLRLGDYVHPPGPCGIITKLEVGGEDDSWFMRMELEGRVSAVRLDPVDRLHVTRPVEVDNEKSSR